MDNDEYTLLSSKEVAELKQDVDYLKKNPLGGTKEGKTLMQAIEKLNESIEQLIEIFKEAGDQAKAEEREADIIVNKIEPIVRKLDELSDQNQKIAKGILAIVDMIAAREQERPKPVAPSFPKPMMPPRPMAPIPRLQPRLPPVGGPLQGMPPPPGMPALKKQGNKGILGLLKKK